MLSVSRQLSAKTAVPGSDKHQAPAKALAGA